MSRNCFNQAFTLQLCFLIFVNRIYYLFVVDRAAILELIWAIFQVLTAAMQDEPSNRVIFMDEVFHTSLLFYISTL